MIVHRNVEVPALKVRVCAVDPEAPAASPCNLQYVQED